MGGNKGVMGVCLGYCGLFVVGFNCDLMGIEMIIVFDEFCVCNC